MHGARARMAAFRKNTSRYTRRAVRTSERPARPAARLVRRRWRSRRAAQRKRGRRRRSAAPTRLLTPLAVPEALFTAPPSGCGCRRAGHGHGASLDGVHPPPHPRLRLVERERAALLHLASTGPQLSPSYAAARQKLVLWIAGVVCPLQLHRVVAQARAVHSCE